MNQNGERVQTIVKEEFGSSGIRIARWLRPQKFRISRQFSLGNLTRKIVGVLPQMNPETCILHWFGQWLCMNGFSFPKGV
jgi:hypothetical protein